MQSLCCRFRRSIAGFLGHLHSCSAEHYSRFHAGRLCWKPTLPLLAVKDVLSVWQEPIEFKDEHRIDFATGAG